MPPSGYEPFLQAICEHPADDAPRLVYADWLEENGDPERAAFIRVQIDRARAKSAGHDWPDLVERDRTMRVIAEARWRPELPRLSGVNWQRFWRGFVSGADFVKGKWFAANAAMAFEATPIQFLRLVDLGESRAGMFAACPLIERLEGLAVHNEISWLGPNGWRELGQSRHLVNLKWLKVSSSLPARPGRFAGDYPEVLDRESARSISDSRWARKLERLEVSGPLTIWIATELREAFGSRFRHVQNVNQ